MPFRSRLIVGVLILLLGSCKASEAPNLVNAADYDAYWLWAGVKPQPVLAKAKRIYILEGEVRADDPSRIVSLRASVPKVKHAEIWLVIRIETVRWTPETFDQMLLKLSRWHGAGNNIRGVQIDFDANTEDLDDYAKFLRSLRQRLPEQFELSVTGLLDWSANGDPAALAELADVVDEAVFQVYQGHKTIAGYERWFQNLDKLPMPFRIGLIQNGEWREPDILSKIPNFQGYVVFLVNQ